MSGEVFRLRCLDRPPQEETEYDGLLPILSLFEINPGASACADFSALYGEPYSALRLKADERLRRCRRSGDRCCRACKGKAQMVLAATAEARLAVDDALP